MRVSRTYTIALAAATFPVLIFAAALMVRVADDERYALETSARLRVERVARELDRELYGQVKALEILAGTDALRRDDMAAFYAEAKRFDDREPLWEGIVLTDTATRQQLVNTNRPYGAALPRIGSAPSFDRVLRTGQPAISGIAVPDPLAGKNQVAIRVPVLHEAQVRYVLTALVSPARIQEILTSNGVPANWYGAVVDGNGLFIARTHDAERRMATPASEYLREAIATAPEGFYKGRLLEGAANYTAYYTSPLTGWSVHLAMPAAEFEGPLHRSYWILAGIAAATLGLSAVVVLVFFRMTAQQRRTELVAQQSIRLQALGQLTGGVAHDFNNLLTVIIGNAELARAHVAGTPARLLDGVLRAAGRAETLTRQLLTFARRQTIKPAVLDLRKRLPRLVDMLQPSVRADIAISVVAEPDLWPIEVDPGELEIALINIAANARDAMPNGGRLEIRARNVSCGARSGPGGLAGDFVVVEIADTGAGMPPEVVERAFEPFFTTKELGRGTGLGLSQVYGFAQQAGGTVTLRSSRGEGTTVALWLRRTHKAVPEVPPPERSDARPTRARTVLLVEDDPDVAEVADAMLADLGYAVVRADRGQRALEMVISGEARADLVLTDVVMPEGMSGTDLARQLHAVLPNLPIVLTTGYNDAGAAGDIDLPLLRKPYKRAELAAVLERALGGAGRPGFTVVKGGAG